MKLPLQISFRGIPRSPEIENSVEEHAARLDEFAERITSCRVVIDVPHRHHRSGNLYQVRIDITLPEGEVVVNRESAEHIEYKDARVAIRDAFAAAVRQVEDFVRRQRSDVKRHEPAPHARVARLFPREDYGFLATMDGRDVYFHRNSVVDADFDRLQVGDEVIYVEEAGDKGPQATTVKLAGRHAGV